MLHDTIFEVLLRKLAKKNWRKINRKPQPQPPNEKPQPNRNPEILETRLPVLKNSKF
jgi:hypothetical protein